MKLSVFTRACQHTPPYCTCVDELTPNARVCGRWGVKTLEWGPWVTCVLLQDQQKCGCSTWQEALESSRSFGGWCSWFSFWLLRGLILLWPYLQAGTGTPVVLSDGDGQKANTQPQLVGRRAGEREHEHHSPRPHLTSCQHQWFWRR